MSETRVERLAVCRLHLADGRVLRNQVVEFSCGRLRCHYPLVGEIAFCRWYGGDCYVGADASISFATCPE